MELLDDSAIIYKMVGPVLVKQDPAEAKQTVTKRLDYITKEMYVILCMCHCEGSTTVKILYSLLSSCKVRVLPKEANAVQQKYIISKDIFLQICSLDINRSLLQWKFLKGGLGLYMCKAISASIVFIFSSFFI